MASTLLFCRLRPLSGIFSFDLFIAAAFALVQRSPCRVYFPLQEIVVLR